MVQNIYLNDSSKLQVNGTRLDTLRGRERERGEREPKESLQQTTDNHKVSKS